jgi:hypothetical protein
MMRVKKERALTHENPKVSHPHVTSIGCNQHPDCRQQLVKSNDWPADLVFISDPPTQEGETCSDDVRRGTEKLTLCARESHAHDDDRLEVAVRISG